MQLRAREKGVGEGGGKCGVSTMPCRQATVVSACRTEGPFCGITAEGPLNAGGGW